MILFIVFHLLIGPVFLGGGGAGPVVIFNFTVAIFPVTTLD
jgi:hypothetical protein